MLNKEVDDKLYAEATKEQKSRLTVDHPLNVDNLCREFLIKKSTRDFITQQVKNLDPAIGKQLETALMGLSELEDDVKAMDLQTDIVYAQLPSLVKEVEEIDLKMTSVQESFDVDTNTSVLKEVIPKNTIEPEVTSSTETLVETPSVMDIASITLMDPVPAASVMDILAITSHESLIEQPTSIITNKDSQVVKKDSGINLQSDQKRQIPEFHFPFGKPADSDTIDAMWIELKVYQLSRRKNYLNYLTLPLKTKTATKCWNVNLFLSL
jgi:hypothetical protein